MLRAAILFMLAVLAGCTATQVKPVDDGLQVAHVCIEDNPRVIREDFKPTLQRGFERHGITSEVYRNDRPAHCGTWAHYTANQTWDMAMVMSDAELWIYQGATQIGYANFHLRGGGGLSLTKWQGSEAKFGPLMDELLREYPDAEIVSQG